MNENLYEAPKATLSILDGSNLGHGPYGFYVVSPKKSFMLFIATLGMYSIYWSYRNWDEIKKSSGESVIPVLRGLFPVFFMHSMFRKVQENLEVSRTSFDWNHRAIATRLVLLILLSNMLDRISVKGIGSPYSDYLSIAVLIPWVMVFLNAQSAINAASGDPDGRSNEHFTPANYFWLLFGAVLWGFTIYGFIA